MSLQPSPEKRILVFPSARTPRSSRRLGLALLLSLIASLGLPAHAQSTDQHRQRALLATHGHRSQGATRKDTALIRLGHKLYFDPRLSADGMISCATCHDVTLGLADRRPLAVGIGGRVGIRNTPTTANVGLLTHLFQDGRASSLEEQAKAPILNPSEMGHESPAHAVSAIASDPIYRRLFQEALGKPPFFAGITRALAAFQRTLIYLDAPYDRWRAGDESAISAEAKRGHALFTGRARCARCHDLGGERPLGMDGLFHNTGTAGARTKLEDLLTRAPAAPSVHKPEEPIPAEFEALGRYLVTRKRRDVGAFRTASLRNVGVTAPYMHDGSMETLAEVIRHYARGGRARSPFLDPRIRPLRLERREIDDLVAFLLTLTDRRFSRQQRAEIQRQGAIERETRKDGEGPARTKKAP